MANGQQKSQQNIEKFMAWSATKTNDDYKQLIRQGILNRTEIAKEIGVGKSALRQNPRLKKLLAQLENRLRQEGLLPPLTEQGRDELSNKSKVYDHKAPKRSLESRRLSALEAENIALKAEVQGLRLALERYGELSETLSEMGFMPR